MSSISDNRKHLQFGIIIAICCAVYWLCMLFTKYTIAIPALIATLLLFYSLNKLTEQVQKLIIGYKHRQVNRSRLLKVLASTMGIFIANGSLLYMIAFYFTTQNAFQGQYDFPEYMLRSMTCSIDLFLLDIDSNIMDDIKDHPTLKSLISCQAILSASCTIALIVSLVFARAKAYYDLHFRTKITDRHNHLYIFFGMNEPSVLLAKDINRHDSEHALIIFIEQIQLNEEDTDGWDNIVSLFSHRENTFKTANETNAKVTLSDCKPHDLDLSSIVPISDGKYDIWSELNISKVKDLILQLKDVADSQLHIFMLSENQDENIGDIAALAKDAVIAEIVKDKKNIKHKFYCHGRRKGINRVVEDVAIKNDGINVQIVDSSHLAVELIKQNQNCQPVRLVTLSKDNPTTIDSEFNSLIIGFDEVGQDAFRYLYEFTAFVDSKSTEADVRRSPYNCVAIDKDMDNIRGVFKAFTPIVCSYNPHIDFVQMDYNHDSFFETYCSKQLNYVVIAAGNEEAGMTLAVRILNYQRINDLDVTNLRIMVRCYTKEKVAILQKIADHYNQGIEQGKDLGIINLFGQPEQIYTYDMIINDRLVEEGKRFQESYAKMKGENKFWDARRAELISGTIDKLRKLRRQESQDLANAVHAATKLYLLKKAMPKDFDWQNFLHRYFTFENKPDVVGHYAKIRYVGLTDDENKIIRNLAMLEHLRWCASHEMLGYKAPDKNNEHCCNEKTRVHNCLINWGALDKESVDATKASGWDLDYKLFDYGTVDTSIYLNQNELLNDND